jgi:AAA+ ATPase superfamily predicted ATPase|tara:strand:- start:7588 stop:7941 length:354 start_codon:yes stop_codon:yes gene_type:complete
MDKQELKQLIKEEIRSVLSENEIGTPEELKQYLYSRQPEIVDWIKEYIEIHKGEAGIDWEEDIKQWIRDDTAEITPGKFILSTDDFVNKGYDEYMFAPVYDEFAETTYNQYFKGIEF